MQTVTNTYLAQQIIARYTSFLSSVPYGAEMMFLALPTLEQPQSRVIEQNQEIHHICNCIEQNTMISVNLNLQFLNQMMTRTMRQVSGDNRRVAQMLERPMKLERSAETQLVRVDTAATKILLSKLRQSDLKPIEDSPKSDKKPLDSVRTLLLRSLTQLTERAEYPDMIQYREPISLEEATARAASNRSPVKSDSKTAEPKVNEIQQTLILPQKLSPISAEIPVRENAKQPSQVQNVGNMPPLHYELPNKSKNADFEATSSQGTRGEQDVKSTLAQFSGTLKNLVIKQETESLQVEKSILQNAPIISKQVTLVKPIAENMPKGLLSQTVPLKDAFSGEPYEGESLIHREKSPMEPKTMPPREASAKLPIEHKITSSGEPPRKIPIEHKIIPAAEPPKKLPMEHKITPSGEPPKKLTVEHKITSSAEPPKKLSMEHKTEPPTVLLPPTALQKNILQPNASENFTVTAPPKILKTLQEQPNVLQKIEQPMSVSLLHTDAELNFTKKTAAESGTADVPNSKTPRSPNTHMIWKKSMVQPSMKLPKRLFLERVASAFPQASLEKKGSVMPTANVLVPQKLPQAGSKVEILPRTDSPSVMVLRAQPLMPRQDSGEEMDDSMDIPTIRIKKTETTETRNESTKENIAINAPHNKTVQTIQSAQPLEIPDGEIMRITDKVYHAIEGRLHSEKMRRGMW